MNSQIQAAIKAKNFNEALALLDAEKESGENSFAYNRARGSVLSQMQKPDEAAEHYQRAISSNGADPAAHNEYGKLLFKLRRYDDAVRELQVAREISSGKVGCIVTLSKALDKSNRPTEAIALLDEQINKNPSNPEPRYHRALILSKNGDAEGAIAEMRRVVELSPENYKYNSFAGQILAKDEQPDDAIPYLMKAEALEPTNPGHLLPLANSLERQKRYDEATIYFNRFLDVTPGERRETALIRMADVSTGKKDHAAAARYCDEVAAIGSQRAKVYQRRATIHRQRIGIYQGEAQRQLDEAKGYFDAHRPNLDDAQAHVLNQIVDKGYCVSSFDDLFGPSRSETWDRAERRVEEFRTGPKASERAERISACENFNKDPYFKEIFKPSVVNYIVLEGPISATDDMVQMYLDPRLLNIANTYNGMLSKIRNVNLWVNPPISGKNIGERKGSQIWHRDQEDTHILKCFIYYSDVDENSGATEYVPYSKCTPDRKYSDVLPYPASSGYPGKYLMDSNIPMGDRIAAVGKRKSILFLDTNGFHRGGYVTGATRVLTMCTYLRPTTPYADTNTKLNLNNVDLSRYGHETRYGLG